MDRQEIILEFIKVNKGCTKTQVINYMDPSEGEKIASPATTFKYIKILAKEKKIFSLKEETNGSIHHLFLNDRHDYNQLTVEIRELAEKTRNSINMIEINSNPFFTNSSNAMLVKMYFYLFREIADMSNKIKRSIMAQEDKDRLYHRLNEVLSDISELNNVFSPDSFDRLKVYAKRYSGIDNPDDIRASISDNSSNNQD